MIKKVVSFLLCTLMIFVSLDGTLAETHDPCGKNLSDIYALYMSEGGDPNENERFVYETIHNHKITLIYLWEVGDDDSISFLQTIQAVHERFSENSKVLVVGCCWNSSNHSNSEIWQILQDNGCTFRSIFLDAVLSDAVGSSIQTPSVLAVGSNCIIQDYIYDENADYDYIVSLIYDYVGRPNGTCGNGLLWTFYPDTGLLKIEVDGSHSTYQMEGYYSYAHAPWYNYRNQITSLQLADSINFIGNYAFEGCINLHSVDLPEQLTLIGDHAFLNCPINYVIIPPQVWYIAALAFTEVNIAVFLGVPPDGADFGSNCTIYYVNANAEQWAPNGENTWYDYMIRPLPIVTFVDSLDDSVLFSEEVLPLCSATAPESPEHIGYTFIGWDADFSSVIEDLTVYAQYERIMGDINCDGIVDSSDITIAAAFVMNAGSVKRQGIINGDMNGDGILDAADLSALYSYIQG